MTAPNNGQSGPPAHHSDVPLPGESIEPAKQGMSVTNVPTAPPVLQQSPGVIAGKTEVAVSAAAATAKAMIESRYIIAQHRPRNWMTVHSRLMEAAQRPAFAAFAEYKVPRWDARQGKMVNITGPTIRFAEEALRCAGNIDVRVDVLNEDDEYRVLFVSVLDLESNNNYGRGVVLRKTMQRAKLKEGQTAISKSINSTGQVIYTIAASEDDLRNKQNAEVSRIVRNDGLRLIPADIRQDALMLCAQTREKEGATDPAAAAKRIAFGFYNLGVDAAAIEAFLGKKITAIKTDELEVLRSMYIAMQEGEATWDDLVETYGRKTDKPGSTEVASPQSLRERVAQKKEQVAGAAPAPATDDEGRLL